MYKVQVRKLDGFYNETTVKSKTEITKFIGAAGAIEELEIIITHPILDELVALKNFGDIKISWMCFI